MILQALVRYYEQLPDMEKPGWQSAKVPFALRLNESGELRAIHDLRENVQRGRKKAMEPQTMLVPQMKEHTSNVAASFLIGNAEYMLGINSKGDIEHAKKRFEACAARHHEILNGIEHPMAKAILRYFDTWNPVLAEEHPLIKPMMKELETGNLVFQLGLDYAHEIPEIREAWQNVYHASSKGVKIGRCLVTGETTEIARLHPLIKGVKGASSTGAKIVSFNQSAFESYAHDDEQGFNAPVGEYTAFAYGAALNRLLSDQKNKIYLGDTTIVFWAEDAKKPYADMFSAILGNGQDIQDKDLLDVMKKLKNGQRVSWENLVLNPENQFYILGFTANKSRVSVRFFLQDSYGGFIDRIMKHHDRMNIVCPEFDRREYISIFSIFKETVRSDKTGNTQKSYQYSPNDQEELNKNDKDALIRVADSVLRAILTDGRYPEMLYQRVQRRIRAEHEITRGKAAIIKAYLLKNTPEGVMKAIVSEVAQVKLNEETRYAPYVLGRIFAILEIIQIRANQDTKTTIKTTIRDKYFGSACCTPAVVFPVLIRLAQAHLKKMDVGAAVSLNKKLQTLMGMLDEEYPNRLNLKDQGIFQLGYYHQRQKLFEKKEEKNNG